MQTETRKLTLCLDFDGVLHAYTSGWQGPDVIPDGPVPGAMEWLADAAERYDVAVFSSRSHQENGIKAMQESLLIWLTAEVGTTLGQRAMSRLRFPTVKPSAHLSIDDRGFRFEGTFPGWEEIDNFKPWNRR